MASAFGARLSRDWARDFCAPNLFVEHGCPPTVSQLLTIFNNMSTSTALVVSKKRPHEDNEETLIASGVKLAKKEEKPLCRCMGFDCPDCRNQCTCGECRYCLLKQGIFCQCCVEEGECEGCMERRGGTERKKPTHHSHFILSVKDEMCEAGSTPQEQPVVAKPLLTLQDSQSDGAEQVVPTAQDPQMKIIKVMEKPKVNGNNRIHDGYEYTLTYTFVKAAEKLTVETVKNAFCPPSRKFREHMAKQLGTMLMDSMLKWLPRLPKLKSCEIVGEDVVCTLYFCSDLSISGTFDYLRCHKSWIKQSPGIVDWIDGDGVMSTDCNPAVDDREPNARW